MIRYPAPISSRRKDVVGWQRSRRPGKRPEENSFLDGGPTISAVRFVRAMSARLLALASLSHLLSFLSVSLAILLYPKNSLFQITLGVSVPVLKHKRGSIVFSTGFQLNYALPSNLSELESTVVSVRNVRDLNLQDTYTIIENLLDEQGWGNGRECFLRTICELARTPLARTGNDVIEETIHLILTPTEDLSSSINSSHRSVNKLYQDAERLGRSDGDCALTYNDCTESPLESFTESSFSENRKKREATPAKNSIAKHDTVHRKQRKIVFSDIFFN